MAKDRPMGNMKFGIGVEGIDKTLNTLDKLNKAFKQQESAMKANLSGFDKASQSIEKYSQKESDLAKLTELQSKKVDILNKRREEAIQTYGKESKQVANLTTEINKSTQKYNNYQRELDSTRETLIKMGNGLTQLNTDIKKNAQEFNAQSNALKKSGDEAGALEVRQQGLRKQSQLVNQAIQAQEQSIKEMGAQFGKSSAQVQKAEQELGELKRQAQGTDTELEGVSKGLKNVGKGASDSEGAISLASTALGGLVAGVGMAVATKALDMISDAANEVKENLQGGIDAVDQFKGALGLSPEDAKVYSRLSNDLVASGLVDNLDEATEAMIQVKNASTQALNDEQLKRMTAQAIAFAKATGGDVNETIRGATRMIENFGISSDEAFDLLAAGAQRGLNQSDELGDNMAEYSQLWSQMGYDAETTFSLLQAGLDGGAYNLDKVNDLVKEMGISLTDGRFEDNIGMFSASTQDLFNQWKNGNATQAQVIQSMMQDFAKMGNSYDGLNKAGTVWSALGEDNSNKVISAMANASNTFADTEGASKKMTDAMSNTTGIDAFKSSLKALGGEIGISLSGGFGKAADGIESFTTNILPKIQPAVQNVLDVLTPLISKVFDGIAVGARVAGDVLGVFGNFISTKLWPMIQPILDMLGKEFGYIFNFISKWWDQNGARIMKAVQTFLVILTPLFQVAIAIVKSFVESVIGFIKGMVNVITGVIDVFSMVLTGDFTGLWEAIKRIFFGAIQAIWNYINILFIGKIVKGIGGFATSMKSTISGMWTSVKSFFSSGITNTGNAVSGWIAKIWNFAKNMKSNVSTTISQLWNGIKSTFRGGIDTVANWFSQLPGKMVSAVKNGAGSIKNAFKGVFNGVLKAIGGPVNGIIGGANWVLDKLGAPKLKKWDVPQYAKGTGGHPGGPMLVNDGGGAEAVISPNGQMVIPSGKNVMMYGEKGTQVMTASETAQMLGHKRPKYRYAGGTGFLDNLGNMWSGVKDTASNIGNKMKNAIGDVMDFIDDPLKLAKKVLENAVDFSGLGNYALPVAKGIFSKATDALKNKITELFEANTALDTSTGTAGVYKYLADVAAQVMKKFTGMTVTSGYRAGDAYSHGSRNAIDIAFPSSMNGSQANVDAANYAFDHFKNKVGYVITNGRVRDRAGTSGTGVHDGWAPWPAGDHYDHVHINGVKNPQSFGGAIATGKGPGGDWETQIKVAAKRMGQTITQSQVNGILAQIQLESGGRERVTQSTAVWDYNAQTGNLAQGLLQYVPSTFNAFKVRGYENILSGFDQLMAFFNNSNWRNDIQYGRSGWGPRGRRIKPYFNGGVAREPQVATLAENGYPEVVIPTEPAKRGRAMALLNTAKQMLGVKDNARVAERTSSNDDMAMMILLMQQQNELLKALLAKDQNINLNGVKLNDGLRAIQATDERNNNRDLGLV